MIAIQVGSLRRGYSQGYYTDFTIQGMAFETKVQGSYIMADTWPVQINIFRKPDAGFVDSIFYIKNLSTGDSTNFFIKDFGIGGVINF